MINGLLMLLLFLTSVFLILLVLIQRGRGGGLAGAFGGMGGQSAFGTKAGDLFTRITIFTAAFWIILCAFSVKWFSAGGNTVLNPGLGKSAATSKEPAGTPASTGKQAEPSAPGASGAKAPGDASGAKASGDDEAKSEAPAAAVEGTAAPAATDAPPPSDDAAKKDE